MNERKPTINRNNNLTSIEVRLNRAGAELSDAISRTPTGPLREQMTTINILIGDTQAAIRRLQRGEDPEIVYLDLAERALVARKKPHGR